MPPTCLDAAIVGGGPAGLVAALYLARFRRRCLVIDNGQSRARRIPMSHNCAGFPDGIPGAELVERLQRQARTAGAAIVTGEIRAISRRDGGFRLSSPFGDIETATVLLATGVRDIEPPIEESDKAVALRLLRYCPICDGPEGAGRNIAVLGRGEKGAAEALFLTSFSDRITLAPADRGSIPQGTERARLTDAGVRLLDRVPQRITHDASSIAMQFEDGAMVFDCLYSALGSEPQSRLAREAGARVNESGCILVNPHQQSSLNGIYAAGDVVEGLDQIAVAIGHGAIAATAIHNRLRERD